ncbi:DUF1330 domain-containing protein [Algirhabdus cladophorae]|uniref:DUF1330 domain-containing protein n=1 Tax=Algirhabdus cladophorae TaxID=3377108 RepID=UPI003B84A43C
MPKGYWIANNIITDAETYEVYKSNNMNILPKYQAKFLVRGGQQQTPEGESYPRTVVIEFPSYDVALEAYNSAAYQDNIKIRQAVAEGRLVIVEGYGDDNV